MRETLKKVQKRKQKKLKPVAEPLTEEVFGVCECEEMNESLIDDICYATDRIIELEEKLKSERKRPSFTKGVIITTLIFISAWLIYIL